MGFHIYLVYDRLILQPIHSWFYFLSFIFDYVDLCVYYMNIFMFYFICMHLCALKHLYCVKSTTFSFTLTSMRQSMCRL